MFPSLISEYTTSTPGRVSPSASTFRKESDTDPLDEEEEEPDLESSPPDLASAQPSTTYWTRLATNVDDRHAALRLIASSIAEQRQLAVRCILLHPVVLTATLLLLGLGLRWVYYIRNIYRTLPAIFLFSVLVTTCVLLVLHQATRGYLHHSETVGTVAWLREGLRRGRSNSNGNSSKNTHPPAEDDIIIAQDGNDELIGCLVLRTARTNALTQGHPSANGARAWRAHHRRSSSCSSYTSPMSAGRLTGVVRAWTVNPSYRRQGAGLALMEEAVAICRVRRLDGPIFADDHAHSQRYLPRLFNHEFEVRDQHARRVLTDVIQGVTKQ